MRAFKRAGKHLLINGKRVFLRGRTASANYPLTGYPPMNRQAWLKYFRLLKSYGINHSRFHSWCPPEEALAAADIVGVYLQPMHQGASCHCEFNLSFDRNSPKETARIRNCFTQASEALLGKGAFFSRPYGLWADMAFNRDAQSTAVLKQIKAIFDPINVMNPGKLCF